MKISTALIWIFESVIVSYLATCLWFGKVSEWTFLVVVLAIILAVWDNKRLKITKEGIEVDDEENNNGNHMEAIQKDNEEDKEVLK